ncbi:MAG: 2-polyprenyl-3-methyl-6-methoxy-1,4-benzoquinone monooxygenase [Acidithiobacillus sp.]|uniref:2-polyprenyl-3-methyl-6-methoxy-1,4-benzoquinone monooxygenase n=1 Tax=Acidithiobacillus sp. TaxID=1872118 RepID=UPI003D0325F8
MSQAEVLAMLADRIISNVDNALRTLAGQSPGSGRVNPAKDTRDALLRPWQRRRAGRLMRVNHTGEVMAQALYTGQAAGSGDPQLRSALLRARREEEDHLRWCEDRLRELRSRPSLLGPLWYGVGWGMGFAAARRGRGSNLGLVVAVEHLVEKHLDEHLAVLPPEDERSRHILEQMRQDEIAHAHQAETLGAQALPAWSESALKALSKIMTRGALWV